MAFCLWPNQAAAVAGGYGGGRVESPSGGNPSNGFFRQAVMDQEVMFIITRPGPRQHNATGRLNFNSVFVLFGGRDDLAKTP